MYVHCFWHGAPLSLLERLTLKSFARNGFKVKLWLYDTNCIEVDSYIEGAEVCDANEIIPFERIFSYNGKGDCRKGSLGGFSDLFRYYLIYKQGGMYVDMDSTCLSNFDTSAEYIIKPHNSCKTVANLLKAPAGCQFLKKCIELTEQNVTADNTSWILPVKIFNDTVEEFNLQNYIAPINYFGNDDPGILTKIKTGNYIEDKNILPKYVLHWCREASFGVWNYKELFDWYNPKPLSIYYNLLTKNDLIRSRLRHYF